jgi:hypothetical protein
MKFSLKELKAKMKTFFVKKAEGERKMSLKTKEPKPRVLSEPFVD